MLLGSKKGRKFAGKAAKYGGMAVLGALAYNAWQKHQAGQAGAGGAVGRPGMPGEPAAPAGAQPMPRTSVPQTSTAQHGDDFAVPDDARFLPAPESEAGEHLALALLQAMIGAAKADGHIDDAERARIYDAIAAADFDADDKAFLFDELKKPLDVDAIAALSKSPEMATEIYTASAVVVGDPNTEERRYLDRLAGRLGLDAALQDEIEKQIADFEESE
ncbi:MAG: tellurite resistance TerB family protein [Hyphomicrobiales bacterium]|nr:tellurite resistance TerB family protein [Hyphomicrobiales bacterium]